MATTVPPKKNTAYSFEVALGSQADTDIFKTTPTLAAGDVTVSKDGAAFANIGTLPIQISDGVLTVALTNTEMNADRIAVLFNDAAGDEWQDLLVTIHTVTDNQLDDLATPTEVNAECDTALTDYDPPTHAELQAEINDVQTDIAALNDLSDADVWTYATRTLTQSAASVTAAVAGSIITITRGDTLSVSLTGLGSLSGYVSIDFTVKKERSDTDDEAILRIRLNASGTDDGLLRVNGAAASDDSKGSITIDVEADGDITVSLDADIANSLIEDTNDYDVQLITASAVTTLTEGVCEVVEDVTRAVA